jgi:hypothetical protein
LGAHFETGFRPFGIEPLHVSAVPASIPRAACVISTLMTPSVSGTMALERAENYTSTWAGRGTNIGRGLLTLTRYHSAHWSATNDKALPLHLCRPDPRRNRDAQGRLLCDGSEDRAGRLNPGLDGRADSGER